MKISGIVLTYNGEKYLRQVLTQLEKAVDEVLVVDSGSTDETIDILKDLQIKPLKRKFDNYGCQCRYAVKNAKFDWVPIVDQDEILTDDLLEEIKQLKISSVTKDGYYVKRNNYLFGKYIKHGGWGNDWVLRLFDRHKGKHTPVNFSVVKVTGKTGRLKNPIIHHPYNNIDEYLDKVQNYATISSREMMQNGKRFKYRYIFFNPLNRMVKKYLWQRGFLDGFHGLVLAVISFYSVFLKYLKLWELEDAQHPRK